MKKNQATVREIEQHILDSMSEFYARHKGKANDYRRWIAKSLKKEFIVLKRERERCKCKKSQPDHIYRGGFCFESDGPEKVYCCCRKCGKAINHG